MEKPDPRIHRFLLSTTSRFTSTYDSPHLSLEHAWPSSDSQSKLHEGLEANPQSRNYFVLSIELETEPTKEGIRVFPDYILYANRVCTAASILFGKRFDSHGPLLSHQMFFVPETGALGPTTYYDAAPYSHTQRKNFGPALELQHFGLIAPLFLDETLDARFRRFVFTAGRFYLRSLQMFDTEPEFAYLDLITCGEVLANFFEYQPDDLFDDQTKAVLEQIRVEMKDGPEIAQFLQGRMRQIKRGFTKTLMHLLTDDFFNTTECNVSYGGLTKDSIERRLKSAYDLRSQYVHTGIDFSRWVRPYRPTYNEVQLGKPIVDNKDFGKTIALAPTFLGLERTIRFCLLRFIHMNGFRIDATLDGTLTGPSA